MEISRVLLVLQNHPVLYQLSILAGAASVQGRAEDASLRDAPADAACAAALG